MSTLAEAFAAAAAAQPMLIRGRVAELRGLTLLVRDLPTPVGSTVAIRSSVGPVPGEVVGFSREHAIVMLLGQAGGIRAGDAVTAEQAAPTAPVGEELLGRVVDGLGRAIDGRGPTRASARVPLDPPPLASLSRRRITDPLRTGVRALDLMTALGKGQRLGLFAGPGVGKTTLLSIIAKRSSADVSVIGLIGERGREVRDFVETALGEEGLRRSIVVVATGDESPLMRIRAAKLACAAAEHLRDRGRDVMLMIDSVTRFAHAQRQVGLSVGEPPATKGYTPSVFAQLALLLERAGALEGRPGSPSGSITGLFTILVEGDDMTEPVADAARGILDGHVVLSRRLAQRGHFPAIDVLDSLSRVADDLIDPEHAAARRTVLRLIAAHRDVEDLLQIGAYAKGSNPAADAAVELMPRVETLLRQDRADADAFDAARGQLLSLARDADARLAPAGGRPRPAPAR